MRIAAEGDALLHAQEDRSALLGSHQGDRAGERAPTPLGKRLAVQAHDAGGGGQQSGQRPDQRRLARRVGADQRHRVPRLQRRRSRRAGWGRRRGRTTRSVASRSGSRHRSWLPRRARRKYGAPTNAVSDPSGRSRRSLSVRAPMSAITTRIAPARKDAGSRWRAERSHPGPEGVRGDEAHEGDRPRDRRGGAGHDRGEHEDGHARGVDGQAEGCRFVLAEGEEIERAGERDEQRRRRRG